MNVGHVRGENSVRVRGRHLWIGSLGRYRRSKPVGTIASVETARRSSALQCCSYARELTAQACIQSKISGIRGNSIAAGESGARCCRTAPGATFLPARNLTCASDQDQQQPDRPSVPARRPRGRMATRRPGYLVYSCRSRRPSTGSAARPQGADPAARETRSAAMTASTGCSRRAAACETRRANADHPRPRAVASIHHLDEVRRQYNRCRRRVEDQKSGRGIGKYPSTIRLRMNPGSGSRSFTFGVCA
jgi:hypothetical protein